MSHVDDIPACCSADVVIGPVDETGTRVVKHRRKRTYLRLGPQESFLLSQLDGRRSYQELADSFQERFSETITCTEIRGFVAMAAEEGLVDRAGARGPASAPASQGHSAITSFLQNFCRQARRQSPLYFRITLFDPDQCLNWLEPRTRWLFSRRTALGALLGGLAAMLLVLTNRMEWVGQLRQQLSWQGLALAWLTAIVVTIGHEFGHGLACKRYGGEVHEMGALWIFFTPCLFCNVSDAWLLPNRWQRLLVSMAGTYIDFLVWIIAAFAWRVAAPGTVVHSMAWTVVSTCGVRVLFNVNPLLRLDGYYALGDLLAIHNLRRRSRQRWMEHVRWLLWGGTRPAMTDRGRTLLLYGVISWTFTVGFLGVLFLQLSKWLHSIGGVAGICAGIALLVTVSKKYFQGSLGEEFTNMLRTRRRRAFCLMMVMVGVAIFPMADRAGGPFRVRPVVRWEVRAPVAGFLRDIAVDEGDSIKGNVILARVEVPELDSQIARKDLEISETSAKLRRLEAGPRPEELGEQRERVTRARAWHELARHDLDCARESLAEELAQLDLQVAQARTELEYRGTLLDHARRLYERGGLAGQQLLTYRKREQEAETALRQAEARRRAREAEGVIKFEGELARRHKELADTEASLALLEAGSRPEDIEAERAHLERLCEELNHLRRQKDLQQIRCPVAGVVTTPRLKERVGQYVERGTVICVVEDLAQLEAEIAVLEQDARALVKGQPVTLKPRALPFRTLHGKVDRIAPAATGVEPRDATTVTVYCQLDGDTGELRSGMTGFGRIRRGHRPLGLLAVNNLLRVLRTEFWW